MTVTESAPTRQNTVLGTRLLRREDPALLTGEAKFTNDLAIPGALHLALLRSPYAHATIDAVDVRAALALPGEKFVPIDLTCVGVVNDLHIVLARDNGLNAGQNRYT